MHSLETNSEFTPEKWMVGRLSRFLLGQVGPIFRGYFCCFREGNHPGDEDCWEGEHCIHARLLKTHAAEVLVLFLHSGHYFQVLIPVSGGICDYIHPIEFMYGIFTYMNG